MHNSCSSRGILVIILEMECLVLKVIFVVTELIYNILRRCR